MRVRRSPSSASGIRGGRIVDRLGPHKQLGLGHVMIDSRRDDLARMLEILGLVAETIRPAVDAA